MMVLLFLAGALSCVCWLAFTGFQLPEISFRRPSSCMQRATQRSKPPQQQHRAYPTRLRCLTQNVWAHYFATAATAIFGRWGMTYCGAVPKVMFGLAYKKRLQLLAAFIAKDQLDVVCLQELFLLRLGPFVYTGNFRFFAALMAKNGYVYHTDPAESLPSLFGQNSGTCIFSRFPLVNCETFVYTHSKERPQNAKGFVCASVLVQAPEAPTGRQHLVETVFISMHADSRHWPSQLKQYKQIQATISSRRKQQESTTHNGAPEKRFVVSGDFNMCPRYGDGSPFKALCDAMQGAAELVPLWHDDNSLPPPTLAFITLDHVFLDVCKWRVLSRDVARYTDDAGRHVSDHLGVIATLEPR